MKKEIGLFSNFFDIRDYHEPQVSSKPKMPFCGNSFNPIQFNEDFLEMFQTISVGIYVIPNMFYTKPAKG